MRRGGEAQIVSHWRTSGDDGIHPSDVAALSRCPTITYSSFAQFATAYEFCRPDSTLHTGLLPMPFVGSLSRAKVFLLMLNPGLSPTDYFGEFEQPTYRAALKENLAQSGRMKFPFLFLNPHFAWHDGFRYWHLKLKSVIQVLSWKWCVPYYVALRRTAQIIASIELLPYHSAKLALTRNQLRSIPSVNVAREFVQRLHVRAREGEITMIVARSAELWGLRASRNVIVYSGPEARAAHMSVHSRAGEAIVRMLGRTR